MSLFNAPDFIETQRISFLRLIKDGIPSELEKHNPIDLVIEKGWPEWHRRFKMQLIEENWVPFFFKKVSYRTSKTAGSSRILYNSTNSILLSNIDVLKSELHQLNTTRQISIHRKSSYIDQTNYFYSSRESRIKRYCHKDNTYAFSIFFNTKNFHLTPPLTSARTCLLTGQTYGTLMKVPIELKDDLQKRLVKDFITLGKLPLMTNRGHFIINGSPRVILHQLVRSPGVYFHKTDKGSYADIICNRGAWVRIEVDKKDLMWLRMRNTPKIPMLIFLQALGVEHPLILSKLKRTVFTPMRATRRSSRKPLPLGNISIDQWMHYLKDDLLKQKILKKGTGTIPNANKSFVWSLTDGQLINVKNYFKGPEAKENDYRLKTTLRNQKKIKNFIHPLSAKGKRLALKEKRACEKMARVGFPFSRYARLLFNYLLIDNNEVSLKKEKYNQVKYTANHLHVAFMFLESKLDIKVYDLSEVGRYQLNKKLGLTIPLSKQTLTLEDFICILNYLSLINIGSLPSDNIDDLKNRRVRSSGELIQNQIATSLIALRKLGERERDPKPFEKVFNKTKPVSYIFKTKPIENTLRQFFNVNPLSQFLDQINSLAEITHKRRLSSLGQGGITQETAGMKIRSIHPSHYGRICPIETPEGQNAGLVNSLATYARINKYGFIETPFYSVINGQVQKNQQILYLTAAQDENVAIAPPDLKVDKFSFLKNRNPPTKLGAEFGKLSKDGVDFFSVSRIQLISIATSLIPFLEHNDANRALMGSNMQRQAVPLVKPERPVVGTGLEGRVLSDSGYSIQARESGIVTYISSEKIKIFSFFSNKKLKVKLTFQDLILRNKYLKLKQKYFTYFQTNLTHTQEFLTLKTHFFYIKKQYKFFQNKYLYFSKNERNEIKQYTDFHSGVITYYLQRFDRSNQNTYQNQRPLVSEGQWVAKGACLVDCSSSAYGSLAVGKNILVAYLPWEGYNFEDAILVSERLVYDDLFTSLHVIKYETSASDTEFGIEKIVSATKIKGEPKNFENLNHLDKNGIVKLGSWVKEGQILVRKLSPVGKTTMKAHKKFLYVIFEEDLPTLKDTSLRVAKGVEGRVIQLKIKRHAKNNIDQVTIWITEKKWLQVGDKMAGRHGNKGIVSKIIPRQDMPYLPDGTPIDMVLNPLGVPSRMNVGQIYECLLGLAGKYLNQTYNIIPFDEISGPQSSRSIVYSKLYEASQKVKKNWLFQPQNPGKMRVFDGRTGLAFDQSVTIGQAYMLKLIHLVDEKIHARATGPYTMVTQQPLRGRSKKGGQRIGEMEVWAIEGFGAAYTLQELLTFKSDDLYGRQQVLKTFFEKKPIKIGKPEAFRVLIRELQALCLKIQIFNHPMRTPQTHNWRPNPVDLNSQNFNLY
jgi:DNA-directed RNA polymerase subunit beta